MMPVLVSVHGVAATLMTGGTSPKIVNSKAIHWRFLPQRTLLAPLAVVSNVVTVLESDPVLEELLPPELLLPPQENMPAATRVDSTIKASCFFLINRKAIHIPELF
jgi:hypothetical protein